MPTSSNCLAVDLGAESGRAVIGTLDSTGLSMRELHRFPNEPVRYNGELHWDIARLWLEIQRALAMLPGSVDNGLSSIGVDTWGLDYALLGESGVLLENPYHHRDARTDGMVERVCEIVPAADIYAQTGAQFIQVNALYQLYAASLKTPRLLSSAKTLLTIPDLLNYWLTGRKACEYTNATTTQFFHPSTRAWAVDLLERLGIPTHFLAPVIEPGTVLGNLLPDLARRTNVPEIPVIAPACHDTGSAVAAIPMTPKSVFISSGTWSLMGTEIEEPLINEKTRELNFTNEGGVCGTIRLLKNIAGLWILQGCRRHWNAEGLKLGYGEIMDIARQAPPLVSFIDPDHSSFLRSERMPESIAAYCRKTSQPQPANPGACARAVLESLALKYRYVLESLEDLTGERYEEIRIVGGGAKNKLLNQLTADATARRVVAGLVEATSLGNIAMQFVGSGAVDDVHHARRLIDESFPSEDYEPANPELWEEPYRRFRDYCRRTL